MASSRTCLLFLWTLSVSSIILFFTTLHVNCDEADNLFQGINSYRESLNLSTLVKNSNAACLAQKLADQFKGQPCTNATGADTVPGTEPQFANYPTLLADCHLNVSDTQDGAVMPACVPNLDPNLVLTNFTKTQYSESLNDTKFTGAGIGSDGNWIVVVLTPAGSYTPYNAATLTAKSDLICQLLVFFMFGSFFLF